MESFRTNAKVIKLNVNDEGYCVELQVSNDVWIKAFLDFAIDAEKKSKDRLEMIKATDDISEKVSHVVEFDKELKAGIAKLFGEGAYEQIFGADLVGAEYVVEFMDACMPYIEERVEQREKAFSKYSADKTGGAHV